MKVKLNGVVSKRKDHEDSLKASLKKPYVPTTLLGWSIVQTSTIDPSDGFEKWGFAKHMAAAQTIFGGEGWRWHMHVEEKHGRRIRDALRLHTRDTNGLYESKVEVKTRPGQADEVIVTFAVASADRIAKDNQNRRQRAVAAKRFWRRHPERVKMTSQKTKMRNKHMTV